MLRSRGTPFLPVYEIELASTILYNSRKGTVVYVWDCVSSLLFVLISAGTCAYHNTQGTEHSRKPNFRSYLSPGTLVSEPSLRICRLEIFFPSLRSLYRAEIHRFENLPPSRPFSTVSSSQNLGQSSAMMPGSSIRSIPIVWRWRCMKSTRLLHFVRTFRR